MYFDVTLSMGSASAAYCCQRMTNAITYIYGQFGYEDINYLDDLGAAAMDNKAEEAFDCLGYILDTIGIHESEKKGLHSNVHSCVSRYTLQYPKHDHDYSSGVIKGNLHAVDRMGT